MCKTSLNDADAKSQIRKKLLQ